MSARAEQPEVPVEDFAPEHADAWLKVIQARLARLRDGGTKLVSVEELKARIADRSR